MFACIETLKTFGVIPEISTECSINWKINNVWLIPQTTKKT